MSNHTDGQRILNGVVETIAAGASSIINVTGTGGTVCYSASGTATILPCTADGTAALGASAAAVTLGAVNTPKSCFQKITAVTGPVQVHVI